MAVTINMFWVVVIIAIILIAYFIKECFFKTKDSDITNNIIEKYPSVSPLFLNKSIREQNIENNQEIHEINKRFDKTETQINELKETINSLTKVIEELQKRG